MRTSLRNRVVSLWGNYKIDRMTKRKVYLPKQTVSALHDVLQENPSGLQTMLLKYRVPSTWRDIKIYSLSIFFFYILFLILVYYGSYLIKPFAVGPFLLRQRKRPIWPQYRTGRYLAWGDRTAQWSFSSAFDSFQILSESENVYIFAIASRSD